MNLPQRLHEDLRQSLDTLHVLVDSMLDVLRVKEIGFDCCVLTSRTLLDCLGILGVKATHHVCHLSAWNPDYCDPDGRRRVCTIGERIDCILVPRHMVVVAHLERPILIDPTINQVSRPQFGVTVDEPLIHALPVDRRITGNINAHILLSDDVGSNFEYIFVADPPAWYESGADWNWSAEKKRPYLHAILNGANDRMNRAETTRPEILDPQTP